MLTNIVGGVFRYPAHETETPKIILFGS
jgi:hypothetical protein